MKFQLDSSKPRIFPSTASPSTGWKFSFLVLSEVAVNATCPSITVTLVFPRRILLLASTTAPAPIAVPLVRFPLPNGNFPGSGIAGTSTTWALAPMAVLSLPVRFKESALDPMAVLLFPVRLKESVLDPTAVLSLPAVLLNSALTPLAVLAKPMVFLASAAIPLAVFCLPVVLLKSALTPLAVLESPVVLLKSAVTPLAVLAPPVVLLTSA